MSPADKRVRVDHPGIMVASHVHPPTDEINTEANVAQATDCGPAAGPDGNPSNCWCPTYPRQNTKVCTKWFVSLTGETQGACAVVMSPLLCFYVRARARAGVGMRARAAYE